MSSIVFEKNGYLARIHLNRPDKLNAVHPAMVAEIDAALNEVENDDEIRVLLFSGEGRAFSAGFDINATDPRENESATDAVRRELEDAFNIIMRIWDCNKPTIAAVHGYCLGSAMEMSAVCDLTISSDDCRFGAPEVTFGSGIVCLILPWIIGFKHANEILLLGRKDIDAQRAANIGLINQIVTRDELEVTSTRIARELASNDFLAVAETRRAIHASLEAGGMRAALKKALEVDVQIETTETEESSEFNRILEENGLRAALDWRASILDNAN